MHTLSLWSPMLTALLLFSPFGVPQQDTAPPLQRSYTTADGRPALVVACLRGDSLSILRHVIDGQEVSSWQLPCPVFRLEVGDVNADGLPEIAVGVTKATRYSPTPQRRLFIFKLYHARHIRPLWLGSRLGGELCDFCLEHDSLPVRIRTRERRPDGTCMEAIYRQQGFGLRFERYLPPPDTATTHTELRQ